MAAQAQGKLKKGRASMVGGIATGLAVLVIWELIARELDAASPAVTLLGIAVAAAIAAWIRIADL